MFGRNRNFGGLADRREALFFDCLARQVAGEKPDAALGEGRRRGQGATSAGGVEGIEVAEPGGEGDSGGTVLLATAGEALEVAAEEGDLSEGKGEGANLLGAQAVLEGVEVAPGGAGAGSLASTRHVWPPVCLSTDGRTDFRRRRISLGLKRMRAGATTGGRSYTGARQARPLRVYGRMRGG